MLPLLVSFQRRLGVESGIAALFLTRMGPEALVFFPDMLVERLPFPEALAAILAAEPVCTFVDELVSFQPGASHEALATAFPLANMFSFVGMNGLDMLLQVFILNIVLITVFVGALKGAGVGVGVEMVS